MTNSPIAYRPLACASCLHLIRARAGSPTKLRGVLVCRMRGSRLQHIGILLSVVWAFGSTLYLSSELLGRAGQASSSTHQACIDKERQGRDASAFLPREAFAKCSEEAQATRDALMEGRWVGIALIAFAPAIAWLMVYGLIAFVASRRP